mmetsp:Transcript_1161/g.2233  ORF Transcript_1161/g.2233 Transcript_1161/m.2233 type:complete len:88 (+) Transcript_1161:1917-2180(+)
MFAFQHYCQRHDQKTLIILRCCDEMILFVRLLAKIIWCFSFEAPSYCLSFYCRHGLHRLLHSFALARQLSAIFFLLTCDLLIGVNDF